MKEKIFRTFLENEIKGYQKEEQNAIEVEWILQTTLDEYDTKTSLKRFIFEQNGEILGYVDYRSNLTFGREGILIHRLYVARDHRKKGIGQDLLSRVEKESVGGFFFFAHIVTEGAEKLLQKNGYTLHVDSEDNLWGTKTRKNQNSAE